MREATVRLRDLAPQHGGIWLMPPGRVKDPAIALETCGHKRQHAFGEPAQPGDDPGRSARVWRALIVTDPQHAPILPGTRGHRISESGRCMGLHPTNDLGGDGARV
jgi:hypothetical protein